MTDFEPFDLKRAEAGEQVMFRSSKGDVQFLKGIRNRDGEVYDTLFLVKNPGGCETIAIRHADGKSHEDILSADDIVMKPKQPVTRTFWACFDLNQFGNLYMSRVTAIDESEKWQHCIPFEFTLPPTKR